MTFYIVKKGDTLSKIAIQHKTTVTAIQKANPTLIKNVNTLQIGWKLKIPKNKDYSAIGKQVEICLNDIKNLPSYKKLKTLL